MFISRHGDCINAERDLEVMDPTMEGSYSWEEGIRVIEICFLCIQAAPVLRPSMSWVVSMLTSEREHFSPTSPSFIDLDGAGATIHILNAQAFLTLSIENMVQLAKIVLLM
jgi:hypothetical protein